MENLENMEIPERQRYRNARQAAIREFLFHHEICRSERQCWEWKRFCSGGYGVIIFDGFKFAVHRMSFEHYKGRIPKGFVVMHDCDNPPCYNYDHLFLGTQAENMQDMVRKGRHGSQKLGFYLDKLRRESEGLSWAWRNPA